MLALRFRRESVKKEKFADRFAPLLIAGPPRVAVALRPPVPTPKPTNPPNPFWRTATKLRLAECPVRSPPVFHLPNTTPSVAMLRNRRVGLGIPHPALARNTR